MIRENVQSLLRELPQKNKFGEKPILVAATKTRTVQEINEAISAGITDIGENRAQEFRDKFDLVLPCRYHFFGRLQKNKVKYLVGKAFLIHSVDDLALCGEISVQSENKGIETNVLLEVNLGEEQKGGIPIGSIFDEYEKMRAFRGVRIKGLMTVLPAIEDKNELFDKCLQMREVYDIIKKGDNNIEYLSMGMSADYTVALEAGSNMIRIGSRIFGARN